MFAPIRTRQRGQVLVIFTGGLIALLVVAALVIDLGFTFMIRRAEQNAVDPGAVAAARFIRAPGGTYADMVAAACFYAQQNGFFANAPGHPTDTGCIPANDPDGTTLTVNWPPGPGAGTFAGDTGKVEVIINRQHRSFLAGVVGITQIGITSSAVAAFDDGNSNSSSLIALDPGGCSGSAAGLISGGGTVDIVPAGPGIEGGYVHVNSSCGTTTSDDACSNSSGALKLDGSGSRLNAPKTYVVGACSNNTGLLDSILDEGSVVIGDPLADLPPPDFGPPGAMCGDPALDPTPVDQTTEAGAEGCDFKKKDTTYHLSPGVYYGGWKVTGPNVTLHLNPGIYIIAGGGVSVGASGTITSVSGASGPAPVMIFSTDDPMYVAACRAGSGAGNQCQDNLNFTASSDLLLRGMTTGPYKGILMWQDGDGSGVTAGPKLDINLSGQTSLNLSGTIYNPRGVVTVDGGGIADGYAAVQIISWRWKITGGGTIHMPYDPNLLYQFTYKGLVR